MSAKVEKVFLIYVNLALKKIEALGDRSETTNFSDCGISYFVGIEEEKFTKSEFVVFPVCEKVLESIGEEKKKPLFLVFSPTRHFCMELERHFMEFLSENSDFQEIKFFLFNLYKCKCYLC